MAINKRKDAAALFELIDKSTLKVPKHAGALKIPDWWSSKSNPAIEPAAKATQPEELPTSGAKIATVPVAPVQPRLFEPPPATAKLSSSPSIRPPPTTVPAANGQTLAASIPTGASTSSISARPAVAAESKDARPPSRMFAPQTMDQDRGNPLRAQWAGQQKRRMARASRWALLAGLAIVLIVIVLVAWLLWMLKGRSSTTPTIGAPQAVQTSADEGATPLQRPSIPQPSGLTPNPPAPLNTDPQTSPPGDISVETAKVYGPGTVARTADQYYVMISSTPTASVAQKNADFLARHGVDVSIEIVAGPGGKGRWFKIISAKGFPTLVAAEPFRRQIVLIGHMTPDFKKGKKVWDDAFITHVTSIPKK